MSELKAFDVGLGRYCEDGSPCVVAFDADQNPRLLGDEKVYLKSEADKVIAEKDTEIVELKKSLEQKNIAEGSVRRILWELMDGGIIKEWYFNGKYNVLLSADDPHIQIAELKTKIEEVSLKFCKQLRHQKYKLCLAMAERCEERYYYLNSLEYYQLTDREYRQVIGGYWDRWLKRWLELAEKFKEANV